MVDQERRLQLASFHSFGAQVGTIFVNSISNLLATCCLDARLKAVPLVRSEIDVPAKRRFHGCLSLLLLLIMPLLLSSIILQAFACAKSLFQRRGAES